MRRKNVSWRLRAIVVMVVLVCLLLVAYIVHAADPVFLPLVGRGWSPADPQLVHLSWSVDDVYHTMTAVWWTLARAASEMVYDTASHANQADYPFTATGGDYRIAPQEDRHGQLIETSFPGQFHEVHLAGLEPGTLYYFRVGGEGFWSREWGFRTIGLGQDIKFVVGGDSRRPYAAAEIEHAPYAISNWPYARDLVTAHAAQEDPDFIWFLGDMVNTGNDFENWQNWFTSMQDNLVTAEGRMIPIVAVIGNHELGAFPDRETTPAWFQGLFANPGDELTFVLNFPNLHLTSLRADGQSLVPYWEPSVSQAQEQRDWLAADLRGSEAEWKLVAFHMPYFSCFEQGTGYPSEPFLYHWWDVLENPDYGADVVFTGHVHNYLRTWPIDITSVEEVDLGGGSAAVGYRANYTMQRSSEEGLTYVAQGCWGAPTDPYIRGDDCDIRPFMASGAAVPSYTIVEIGAMTLRMTTKTTAGDVLDDVTLPYVMQELATPVYNCLY